MAKYYDCGTSLANVGAALTDYYGAGVTVHVATATNLIFTCPAISDKVIQFYGNDMFACYGTAYDGESALTEAVEFGGNYSSGSVTKIHLVLSENLLLANAAHDYASSKLCLVGKLSNGAFAVLAASGGNSSTYRAAHFAYLTATQTPFQPLSLTGDTRSETGKIFKMPLVIRLGTGDVPMSGGVPVTWLDVSVCSRRLGASTMFKGDGYFITTSDMYFDGGVLANSTSLLVEDITN
jgi:hypothetical protein